MYTINSGLGPIFYDQLGGFSPTGGKLFVVCPIAHPNFQEISDVIKRDEEGIDRRYTTIAAAMAQCVAGRGDVILIMEGYTDTVSSATILPFNIANVKIIGLGTSSARPTITYNTANTATIPVSASGITIQNCIFVANFLAIANAFTLTTAKDFNLINCDFRDTSAVLNFVNIVTTDTTSNHADGLLISGCNFMLLATSGAVNLFAPLGTNDRCTIINNYFASLTTNAGAVIPIATGKILTNFKLLNNRFNLVNATGTSTGYIITTNGSTNTGFIDGNMDHALPTSPLFCTASSGFVYGANYHSETADKSGFLLPATNGS